MNNNIDIVLPWVDGTDQVWLQSKTKWYERLNPLSELNNNNRYQTWDNLKYWFRSVERNMPWINRVFFVTCGHLPDFLNEDCPKLKVVRHDEFIPTDYLPTFQANPIELNLHRIQGLSENFIYFNDDVFPLTYIDEEYYFRNDKICDEAVETPIIPTFFGDVSQFTWNMKALDTAIINRNFNKRVVQKSNPEKWFCTEYGDLLERNECCRYWNDFAGFRDPHMPNAFKKSTFEKVWKAEYEILDRTCKDKFRNFSNVNQWLFRYWQLCEGDFYPRRTLGKSYTVTVDNCFELTDVIRTRSQQMICLNEQCVPEEFDRIKTPINAAFEDIFPEKSIYEK